MSYTPKTVYVDATGDEMSGDLTIAKSTAVDSNFILKSVNQQAKRIAFRTNDLSRWSIQSNNTNETGVEGVGSDFAIWRFNNAGGAVDEVIKASRLSGQVTLGSGGGLSLGSNYSTGMANISKHIRMYGNTVGMTVYSDNSLVYVCGTGGSHIFLDDNDISARVSVGTPTGINDAVTKKYVDGSTAGAIGTVNAGTGTTWTPNSTNKFATLSGYTCTVTRVGSIVVLQGGITFQGGLAYTAGAGVNLTTLAAPYLPTATVGGNAIFTYTTNTAQNASFLSLTTGGALTWAPNTGATPAAGGWIIVNMVYRGA